MTAERAPGDRTTWAYPPPTPDDRPFGARLGRRAGVPVRFGGFELLEELGQGGMGIVFRARELSRGRTVALKRLLRGSGSSAEDVDRFRVEAMAASHLAHPHIVPVFQVGEQDDQPFFTMQYIEGATLSRRLSEGPMPGLEAARVLVPVCRAIHYAHDRGILHRDLKPSNILIDRDGHPYVSDFGLAKRLDPHADPSLTPSGALLGTPSYMPPEQARGSLRRGPLGPACDVYSLGAILYHMLTGRPPFQAASPVETMMLVLEQDPVPPRVLNPGVRPELEMITLRCLQKQPDQRYRSAAAMADDLEAFLRDEPVSARSTSLRALASRLLGETHHAAVLENWGQLWIYHSVALLVFFGATNALQLAGVVSRLALRAALHRGPGRVGRALLGDAPPGRTDHLRRAAARAHLGLGHRRDQPGLPHRVAARPPRALARHHDRRDQRHALHGQGRHPLGLLLFPGGRRVPGDLADGVVSRASPRSSSASSPRRASSSRA